jgi:transposase
VGAAVLHRDLPHHRATPGGVGREDFLAGACPEVWVADRYGGQTGPGAVRQLCLAHLLRDAQYAIDEGDSMFAPGFKMLLLRAMAIGRRRPDLKDSTLRQYHGDLDRPLGRPPEAPIQRHAP